MLINTKFRKRIVWRLLVFAKCDDIVELLIYPSKIDCLIIFSGFVGRHISARIFWLEFEARSSSVEPYFPKGIFSNDGFIYLILF